MDPRSSPRMAASPGTAGSISLRSMPLGAGSTRFIEADLVDWNPTFSFDVAVGFETIEHLPNYRNYVDILKRARRWIIVSAPVVATVGVNAITTTTSWPATWH